MDRYCRMTGERFSFFSRKQLAVRQEHERHQTRRMGAVHRDCDCADGLYQFWLVNFERNLMNIDSLTFGELKQIAAMFGATQPGRTHPFVGQYVIARCYAAGVHAGEVVSADGENVVLKDSRRLWSWQAKDGVALSGVAQHGLKDKGCKVDVVNPQIYLSGVCELIPVAPGVRESINVYK
jgi:hypothetical protein